MMALRALSWLRDPDLGPMLSACMADESAGVRRQALTALSVVRAPAAQPALSAGLLDPDGDTRATAARALGHLTRCGVLPKPPAPEVLRQLVTLVAEDDHAEARAWAAHALGDAVSGETSPHPVTLAAVRPALFKALGDVAGVVRQHAAQALGRQGQAGSSASQDELAPLAARLADPDPEVRAATARALGRLQAPARWLFALLQDENPGVRAVTAQALGGLCDPGSLAPLRALATRETHPEVQHHLRVAIKAVSDR